MDITSIVVLCLIVVMYLFMGLTRLFRERELAKKNQMFNEAQNIRREEKTEEAKKLLINLKRRTEDTHWWKW